ncbi:MAG: glycosyltransferase [Candidatus Melainabacteria bacterium]|nr:glycosyltransferase [Candidatus Melainabacteria bacterium]
MSLPKISIIMPARNAARFLRQAIASVQAQSFTNWELIVVDDASTDETPAILAALAQNDGRIRVLSRQTASGSAAAARNLALEAVQGEMVGFLDADDIFEPDALNCLWQALATEPQLEAVYGFARDMDEQGRVMEKPVPCLVAQADGSYRLAPGYPPDWRRLVFGWFEHSLAGLLVRRSVLEQLGLFRTDLPYGEDWVLYLKLYLRGPDRIRCLPHYVFCYRQNSLSVTKQPHTPLVRQAVRQSGLSIIDWLFGQETRLPESVRPLRGPATLQWFLLWAKMQLMQGHGKSCRCYLQMALRTPGVAVGCWLKTAGPFWLLSLLPWSCIQAIRSVQVRLKYQLAWLYSRPRSQIFRDSPPYFNPWSIALYVICRSQSLERDLSSLH